MSGNVTVQTTEIRYNIQVTASILVGGEVNEGNTSQVTNVFVPDLGEDPFICMFVILYTIQVASLATLALLLAAIGGSDMSLQYIFVIHVYLGMHQSEVYELHVRIVRVVEPGSNIVYVAMTQVYCRAVMQQSTCYYFPFAFYIYAFISTTSTVTILCTCPIMHDKVIHSLLFALLKHNNSEKLT